MLPVDEKPSGTTQYALDLITALIVFDTTSCYSNLELIDYVKALIEAAGGRRRLTFDDIRSKANLFVTLGPEVRDGKL